MLQHFPDRSLTIDPGDMRRMAIQFYTNLFRAEVSNILEGLPELMGMWKSSLEAPVSFE